MKQLLSIWSNLDISRKVVAVLATLALLATVITLARMAATPSLSLLYSGLENGPAGEVVRALEQRNVAYEVRAGSIFVESDKRDKLRMTLASEGMPANNNRGYELLDSLSGFGTTSQMFTAAYWRAKEGELSRTIAGSPLISSARVHIANTSSSAFRKNTKASASISITANSGVLPSAHAQALKHLVSSAVAGLLPENVAVIDASGALIAGTDEMTATNGSDNRADILRQKVERILEARVGRGNVIVEVSVDTVTETELIREHVFDPEGRVAISTDTEETSTNAKDTGGGEVTVASNLPDGDAASGESSSKQNSETRERVNYEISETHREVTREPGAIKRMTVAVLVNNLPAGQEANAPLPRPDDEMEALRELVASTVGFDESRGDVITIKSMAFLPLTPLAAGPKEPLLSALGIDALSILQIAVLAIVALILGLFVVRPVLTKPRQSSLPEIMSPAALEGGDPGTAAQVQESKTLTPLTGMIDDGDGEFPDISIADDFSTGNNFALPSLDGPDDPGDPVERLRTLIGERQEETVEILRSWLEDKEEKA